MRLFLLILAIFFSPLSAFAQEAEKPKIDWVTVESTGVLSTGIQGGMEKTIWQGQKRSEIEKLIDDLPVSLSLRSVLSFQRRILLSKTDAALIENDIEPSAGKDLLIRRINKLMDMGLYDDALDLYTQKAENPYDVSIAQLGMLLLVMKNDLATACLEEKVLASRYTEDEFFKTLDLACSDTLGTRGTKALEFKHSEVLEAVYNNKTFGVSASNPEVLGKMTDLERALVLANGKIRYDGLTREILAKTPPALVTLYLMDKKLPDSAKTMIKDEATLRGLTPYISSISRDELYAKAKSLMKDPEDQWIVIQEALDTKENPADLTSFAAMIATQEPADVSPETTRKVLATLLSAGEALPPFWATAAQKIATENPLVYVYLWALESLTPSGKTGLNEEEFFKVLGTLKKPDFEKIVQIIKGLDESSEILKKVLKIYEKDFPLTNSDYVMHSAGLNALLERGTDQKQIGITALAALKALYDKPDNMYSGDVNKILYSMLNVGLIEDAKLIGAETVATVLNKY